MRNFNRGLVASIIKTNVQNGIALLEHKPEILFLCVTRFVSNYLLFQIIHGGFILSFLLQILSPIS